MKELRKILQLVAEGCISAREADTILKQLKQIEKGEANQSRILQIVLSAESETDPRFRLKLPLSIVQAGLRMIPTDKNITISLDDNRFSLNAVDWEEIFTQAGSGECGDIFNLEYTDFNGMKMKLHIFLE